MKDTRNTVRLYSISDVQENLNVSRPTVNRLITNKILKTVRVGRAVRIPESSLLEFIHNGGERHIEIQEG
jgi:excisionase family DNA binding protein